VKPSSKSTKPLTSGPLVLNEEAIRGCRQQPKEGPRLVFLSGGTGLKETCTALRRHTHNSTHLITPFDSGGSSAVLREAFGMLGVGDLRNRLLALAETEAPGAMATVRWLGHRLPAHAADDALREELRRIVEGSHPLSLALSKRVKAFSAPLLRKIENALPADFDLRGASVGNLWLCAAYLDANRDINTALELFGQLVDVQGTVRPSAMVDAHLVGVREDGTRIIGQHLFGAALPLESDANHNRLVELELAASLDGERLNRPAADACGLEHLAAADLICYPMGSFFTSVLANLLPAGIGRSIARQSCPKIYVPNAGQDPEMQGYSLAQAIDKLVDFASKDAGETLAVEQVLNGVLLDPENVNYCFDLDLTRIADMGVAVLETPLGHGEPDRIDGDGLVRALITLAV
jgi:CofD-related protein of GAK system